MKIPKMEECETTNCETANSKTANSETARHRDVSAGEGRLDIPPAAQEGQETWRCHLTMNGNICNPLPDLSRQIPVYSERRKPIHPVAPEGETHCPCTGPMNDVPEQTTDLPESLHMRHQAKEQHHNGQSRLPPLNEHFRAPEVSVLHEDTLRTIEQINSKVSQAISDVVTAVACAKRDVWLKLLILLGLSEDKGLWQRAPVFPGCDLAPLEDIEVPKNAKQLPDSIAIQTRTTQLIQLAHCAQMRIHRGHRTLATDSDSGEAIGLTAECAGCLRSLGSLPEHATYRLQDLLECTMQAYTFNVHLLGLMRQQRMLETCQSTEIGDGGYRTTPETSRAWRIIVSVIREMIRWLGDRGRSLFESWGGVGTPRSSTCGTRTHQQLRDIRDPQDSPSVGKDTVSPVMSVRQASNCVRILPQQTPTPQRTSPETSETSETSGQLLKTSKTSNALGTFKRLHFAQEYSAAHTTIVGRLLRTSTLQHSSPNDSEASTNLGDCTGHYQGLRP